jgi:hypothetical protein
MWGKTKAMILTIMAFVHFHNENFVFNKDLPDNHKPGKLIIRVHALDL